MGRLLTPVVAENGQEGGDNQISYFRRNRQSVQIEGIYKHVHCRATIRLLISGLVTEMLPWSSTVLQRC